MGGGSSGGSGTTVPPRQPSQEKSTIGNWYDFQNQQAQNYVAGNPLLSAGQAGALSYNSQLPGMLGQFPGFQQQLGGYQDQLQGYANQIPGLQNQANSQFGGYQGQLTGLTNKLGTQSAEISQWLGSPNGPAGIIQSGGALTPQMSRDVSQQSRAIEAAQGTAHSTGALGNELLNRDQYRQQRYNTALQQGQGLLGQQSGIIGQRGNLVGLGGQLAGQNAGIQSGLLGLGSGIAGQGAGLTGQNAGLLGQEQGLQTGGLNQLLGSANANTQNFTGLTNPILGYLGNLFGGNQQANIANAQIQQQANQGAGNKQAGLIGGGASILGSVAVAY